MPNDGIWSYYRLDNICSELISSHAKFRKAHGQVRCEAQGRVLRIMATSTMLDEDELTTSDVSVRSLLDQYPAGWRAQASEPARIPLVQAQQHEGQNQHS